MNGQQLEIPGHVFKGHHDDNDRTRLLKDVLRVSVKLQEDEGGRKPARRLALSTAQPAPKARKDRQRRSLSSAVSMRELATCQDTDMPFISMAGCNEDAIPLLSCGSRISALYTKLQESDQQLRTLAREAGEQEQASRDMDDPLEDIRITNRPEDENPRVIRAHKDQAAYDFIKKHARFHKLEEWQEFCDTSEGYSQMRDFIPRTNKHHPNLALLDHKVVASPEKLQKAIWSSPPPATEAMHHVSSLRNRRMGGGAKTMKARINLQVSTEPSLKRGNPHMQSCHL